MTVRSTNDFMLCQWVLVVDVDVSSRLVRKTQYLMPFDLGRVFVSFTDTIPQQIWNLKEGE